MRDTDRIPEALEALQAVWLERPDMRLGQLLWAICGGDPFYIEDNEILRRMRELGSCDLNPKEQTAS